LFSIFCPGSLRNIIFFLRGLAAGLSRGGKRLKGKKIGESTGELAVEGDLIAMQDFRQTGTCRRAEQRKQGAGCASNAPMPAGNVAIRGGLCASRTGN
jgi:hypothetical protein